ncbi:MAG: hotdog fold thioesterase [Candidatus Methylophosphatis roskildensis]|jgi:1,4-dihydroxy-2-naphthoyl-CoA hydrolase
MAIWHQRPTVEELHDWDRDTLAAHLGIEYLQIGDDFLRARMPVDRRTCQPMGLLHGGASLALAETVGSVAANHCVDRARYRCVGLEINANHARSASSGWVIGTARPAHLGRTTQVWDIRIEDQLERLVCVSRLTMAVVPTPQKV